MDKFVGALILVGVLLAVAGVAPIGGMYFAASGLALLSFIVFAVATGGIHEVAAAVLLVGAFLCIGFANLARLLKDVETVASHFSSRIAAPTPQPAAQAPQAPQPEPPPRNMTEARERAFGTPVGE